ncbi:hypothetical protein [Cupriavidus basilensis]|uniref:hypothetical protein n=1 Tax=Cupriavidus basilensis TaxID=68895 RepID=UPI00284F5D34|nr:hypothetical protein [Cupriavidus basilensis]MDR3381548.1 hypothetical protein [Cupriavidus basilensis]
MTVENAGPDARQQAKPRARGHIEQPGEGRKTTQPGERDPQSQQPADLASTSGQPLLAH